MAPKKATSKFGAVADCDAEGDHHGEEKTTQSLAALLRSSSQPTEVMTRVEMERMTMDMNAKMFGQQRTQMELMKSMQEQLKALAQPQ